MFTRSHGGKGRLGGRAVGPAAGVTTAGRAVFFAACCCFPCTKKKHSTIKLVSCKCTPYNRQHRRRIIIGPTSCRQIPYLPVERYSPDSKSEPEKSPRESARCDPGAGCVVVQQYCTAAAVGVSLLLVWQMLYCSFLRWPQGTID